MNGMTGRIGIGAVAIAALAAWHGGRADAAILYSNDFSDVVGWELIEDDSSTATFTSDGSVATLTSGDGAVRVRQVGIGDRAPLDAVNGQVTLDIEAHSNGGWLLGVYQWDSFGDYAGEQVLTSGAGPADFTVDLSAYTFPASATDISFFLGLSDASDANGDSVVYNNLIYQAVPEPAGALLAPLVGSALPLRRRRRD